MDSKVFQFLAITTMSHVLKSVKRAISEEINVRARVISDTKHLRSKVKETMFQDLPETILKTNKLQVVNTKTNGPIHSQPILSKTYNPYVVLVPFTSMSLLELTVNARREKEKTSNNFGGHLEFKSVITWLRVDQ